MVEALVNYLFSLAEDEGASHPAIWMGLLGDPTEHAAREAIETERRQQKNVLILSMEYSRVPVRPRHSKDAPP